MSHRETRAARRRVLATLQDPNPAAFAAQLNAWLPAPMPQLRGVRELFATFYDPLRQAFGAASITPEIVIADRYRGAVWVAVMGRLQADQQAPYFGVPPGTNRTLRLGLFFRFAGAVVDELRVLFDLPALAAQAGVELLPPFPGGKEVPPSPAADVGLNRVMPSASESERTRRLITSLIGGLNRLAGSDLGSMPQRDFWTDDMRWYGPWGIGACRGFDDYQRYAQGPSVRSFPNRRGTWPKQAFVAEGRAGAFTGWPSLTGDFSGEPFRGIAPTGETIGQNIMDFYVRRGDRLAQNWVFIDLVDFARQCGVDLLRPLRASHPAAPTGR